MIVTNLLTIFAAMMRSERHNKPMKWRDFAAQSKHYIILKIMDNCSRLSVILSHFGSNIKTNVVIKGLYFPVWNYCLFGCSSLWKHDSSFKQFESILLKLWVPYTCLKLESQYKDLNSRTSNNSRLENISLWQDHLFWYSIQIGSEKHMIYRRIL